MQLSIITSIRTNNFNDKHVMDKIKNMWESASKSLTNYEGNVYGVYYDYESDYKGDYSIGVATEKNGGTPIEITTEKYEIFKVDSTDDQGVFKAWSNIWNLEESGTLNRAYTVDFEKYLPNGEIEIHIAVE
ncbi:GyrI-like domain-containing protein [Siminovitchia terrae]|uniref:GyrI-like domain-containing protein n=1 Tax=Siminovitchia terrae TaxID=1914933 RepID=UPI0028ADC989|nr:effector binding domain-containing protein [Siminovitchia terrae]